MQTVVNIIFFLRDGRAPHRCCSLYLESKGRNIASVQTAETHGRYVTPVSFLWLEKERKGKKPEYHPLAMLGDVFTATQ